MDELDILNRSPFVEKIMTILNGLRDNGQSMSFSLNGKWGSGKTFILNMLKNKIIEANNNSKTNVKPFCYIRYDCWKYDYYSEPLVAFISAVQDTVLEDTNAGNATYVKKELKDTVEELGKWGIELAGALIRIHCGVDPSKVLLKILNQDSEKKLKAYDSNHTVTKALNGLRETIKKISLETTLVIVVDELDRCLPEYMIRVLERLHHLLEGLDNVILLVATDKKQIECTIKHIYGEDTNASAYLQKMIQFELTLDCGAIQDEITMKQKFLDYFSLFDENLITKELNLCDFIEAIFRGLEIRKRIQWIDKIYLIHRLTFNGIKPGYDVLYYELFWTGLTKIHHIIPTSGITKIDSKSVFNMFCLSPNIKSDNTWRDTPFALFFTEKFRGIRTDERSDAWSEKISNITIYDGPNDLNMMFWYWIKTIPEIKQRYYLPKISDPKKILELERYALNNFELIKKFQELMTIIN